MVGVHKNASSGITFIIIISNATPQPVYQTRWIWWPFPPLDPTHSSTAYWNPFLEWKLFNSKWIISIPSRGHNQELKTHIQTDRSCWHYKCMKFSLLLAINMKPNQSLGVRPWNWKKKKKWYKTSDGSLRIPYNFCHSLCKCIGHSLKVGYAKSTPPQNYYFP